MPQRDIRRPAPARSRARARARVTALAIHEEPPFERLDVDAPSAVEMTVTPRTAWDPPSLLLAKSFADQGNLEMAADLWESMLADDRTAAAMEQRVQGLEGLALSFEGEDEVQIDALDTDFWQMSSPGARSSLRSWSLGVGIAVAYAESWRENEDGRMLPVLRAWHPRWLRWRQSEREWYIQTLRGEVRLSSEPGRWFLFCPGGESGSRPWVNGLWYSTATWWLQKTYAIADLANFCQSHATPKWFLIGQKGVNVKPAVKEAALAWLGQVIARSGMYVPPGFDLKQEETNSYAWQSYVESIKLGNRALASRILGQHLTTDEAGGAGAVMDDKLRQDLIESDADNESAFWHDGPLRWWSHVNFASSTRGDVPWPKRDVTPPADLTAISTAQKTAAETWSILVSSGADGRVDFDAFAGAYFPLREGDGDNPRKVTPDHPTALSAPLLLEAPQPGVRPARNRHALEAVIYADDVADELRGKAQDAVGDITGEVLRIMTSAGSYEAGRRALLAAFPRLDRSRLRELMTGALLLTQAAGRASVGMEGQ